MSSHDALPPAMPDPDILDRYFIGECSAAEADRVHAWLAVAPEHSRSLDALRAMQRRGEEGPQWDTDRSWGEFQGRVAQSPIAVSASRTASRTTARDGSPMILSRAASPGRRWGLPGGAVALAIGTVAVLGALFAAARGTQRHTSLAVGETRYTTVAGEHQTVTLPDGSLMVLAPSTTVLVSGHTATVVGEAYFAVARHHDDPFVVRTTQVMVRVLGTEFLVRQYSDEPSSRVVVKEGRVELRATSPRMMNGAQTILGAGMLGRITDSSLTVTSGVNLADYLNWTQGRLVFERTPLRDVVAELSRSYGAQITVPDSLLARVPVSVTVSIKTQPLSEILDLLVPVVNAHYERTAHGVVIVPGHVAPRMARPHPSRLSESSYGR